MDARILLVFVCLLAACRHGAPYSAKAPDKTDCQSPEQLAADAKRIGATMDETLRKKMISGEVLDMYERVLTRAARIRSTSAVIAPADECIPERFYVIVTFTGDVADLEAVGLLVAKSGDYLGGIKIARGLIDPTRLGELAAIPHVVSIETPPHLHPVLNYSAGEIQSLALKSEHGEIDGRGVVIGIIDGGIDWRHGSFTKIETQEDGTTIETSRILAIWDQGLDAEGGDNKGPGQIGVTVHRVDASGRA